MIEQPLGSDTTAENGSSRETIVVMNLVCDICRTLPARMRRGITIGCVRLSVPPVRKILAIRSRSRREK